ncbi:MAG: HPr family phosphocarrier protein [Lachnospiraceae bacterium]
MISKDITINISPNNNAVQPVALLVQVANQFESSVYVEVEDKKVNAKSIMGMMSIRVSDGEQVRITANGSDEESAMRKIEEYLTENA